MTKATRKRKLKQLDFKKPKLVVGKKLPQANNSTNVNFKSQSINIPSQSITNQSSATDHEPRNSKHQSIKDLISNLKHYSPQHRKDAIHDIHDLLSHYPSAISKNLLVLVENLFPLFLDDQPEIRKALRIFLPFLFSHLDHSSIKPFMNVIMAYLISSLSHITENIRLDGLKYLDILIESFPLFLNIYSEKILPNVVALLDKHGGKGKSTIANPRSQLGLNKIRFEVLNSLHNLLVLCLVDSKDEYWFMDGLGVPLSDFHCTKDLISSVIAPQWDPQNYYKNNLDIFTLDSLASVKSNDRYSLGLVEKTNSHEIHGTRLDSCQLLEKLMPTLLDFWMESCAIVLSGEIIENSNVLALMSKCIQTMNLLWRTVASQSPTKELVNKWMISLTKYVSNHFPFGHIEYSYRDDAAESAMLSMNLQYCELMCHVFISAKILDSDILAPILSYLLNFLNPIQDGMLKSVPLNQLEATYPVVWTLLNGIDSEKVAGLFNLLLKFKSPTDRGNVTFKSLFGFISTMIKLQHDKKYTGNFKIDSFDRGLIIEWILLLPRKLWEIKLHSPALSQQIIDFFRFLFQSNFLDIHNDHAFVDKFQLSLVPLFHVTTSKGEIYGPFLGYDEDSRTKILDLLFYLPQWKMQLVQSVVLCINNLCADVNTISRFLEMCAIRQRDSTASLDLNIYTSILCTILLIGYGSKDIKALISDHSLRYYDLKSSFKVKKTQAILASKEFDINFEPKEYLEYRIGLLKNIIYLTEPILGDLLDAILQFMDQCLPLDSYIVSIVTICKLYKQVNRFKELLDSNSEYNQALAKTFEMILNIDQVKSGILSSVEPEIAEFMITNKTLYSFLSKELQEKLRNETRKQ